MKKNWLLWGAVAVGAYLLYKKMNKSTNSTGRELAPPPVTTGGKPKPIVTETENSISEEL